MTPPHIARITAKLQNGADLNYTVEGVDRAAAKDAADEYLLAVDSLIDKGTVDVELVEKPRFQITILQAVADQLLMRNRTGWSLDQIDERLRTFDPNGEQYVFDIFVKPILDEIASELGFDGTPPDPSATP